MTGPAEERRSWTRQIMGLPISIHRRGPGADDGFVERIFDDLHGVDAMFSTYRVDSALSRLNKGELLESEMPAPFAIVMRLAGEFRNLTDGAFDVRFSKELDPSGLVKGWATEAAARWLPSDAYLNAGGDMVIKSPRLPWRVGIEHPADPAGLVAVLSVRNLAVATSGTTHRGNHIFDPRTGRPSAGLRQVTVVGPTLTEADVWATALIARGLRIFDRTDPLLQRLMRRGFDALMMTDEGELTSTGGFGFYCAADFPLDRAVGMQRHQDRPGATRSDPGL